MARILGNPKTSNRQRFLEKHLYIQVSMFNMIEILVQPLENQNLPSFRAHFSGLGCSAVWSCCTTQEVTELPSQLSGALRNFDGIGFLHFISSLSGTSVDPHSHSPKQKSLRGTHLVIWCFYFWCISESHFLFYVLSNTCFPSDLHAFLSHLPAAEPLPTVSGGCSFGVLPFIQTLSSGPRASEKKCLSLPRQKIFQKCFS